MSSVFFNITGTVLVLNILFLLVPDGKYAKYVQFVAGLIVILTVAGNFINVSLDYSALNFDETAFSEFDNEELENSVRKDLIEDSVRVKINEAFNADAEVTAEISGNEILGITVSTNSLEREKIIDFVVQYCDINRESVVIK